VCYFIPPKNIFELKQNRKQQGISGEGIKHNKQQYPKKNFQG